MNNDTFLNNGFYPPNFKGEIIGEAKGFYFGYIVLFTDRIAPVKWNKNGKIMDKKPSRYNLITKERS